MKHWIWNRILVGLLLLSGCTPVVHLSPHNLLEGKILTVSHGCGGFETYRNTTPPNTSAAMAQSLAEGADGIEMDVQVSADGKLIVFHDGNLDGATNCAGCIHEMQSETLLACSYKTRNGDLNGKFYLPLLDSMLSDFSRNAPPETYLFLNTKHDSPCDPGDDGKAFEYFATEIVARIHRYHLESQAIVESMSARYLQAVHAVDPEIALLFDDEDFERGMSVVRTNEFLGLCISNGIVSETQVKSAHQEGYWLGIWGVRVLGDTRNAVKKGPELIMTDDLIMLQSAIKE